MKKHLKRTLLAVLILLLALAAFLGIKYYRITSDPAGEFTREPVPSPAGHAVSTVAPLLPIPGQDGSD